MLARVRSSILSAVGAPLLVVARTEAEPPQLTVPRVESSPRLEEFVDPAARSTGLATRMVRVEGFTDRLPKDGVPMSERTEVYLGYTAEAIHAVFVCFESNRESIRAHLAGRDVLPSADDSVALQLDTFRDLTHAYGFQVNPLGVQQDGVWTEGKGWDLSFDTTWHSEGRLTGEGYVVLVSVPFKSLRFAPGQSKTFGMLLFRGITRNSEEGFWPPYSTTLNGRMNQAATLSGIEDVAPGRNWQAAPYLNARAFRTLDSRPGEPRSYSSDPFDGTMGADAKVVLRDSLSLDLSANPDFSQVESDEPQVTVNKRFEVFFPEKRPFFLENAAYFETPIPLFFSRRIQDPDFGARLSGRQGRYAIGALLARDGAGRGTDAVLRVNRDIGAQSTVGFLGSAKAGGPSGRNSVGGIDAALRIGTAWSAKAQVVGSASDRSASGSSTGFASRLALQRNGRALTYGADYNERSKRFESDLGFIDRVDFRKLDQTASYRFFPKTSTLQAWGPDVTVGFLTDRSSKLLERVVKPSLTFSGARLTQLTVYRQEGSVRLRRGEISPVEFAGDVSARFSQALWGASFSTSPTNSVTLALSGSAGDSINLVPAVGRTQTSAREAALTGSLEVRPGRRLSIAFSGLRTRLAEGGTGAPIFIDRILRGKAQFQFSRALSVRSIVQYDVLTAAPERTTLPSRRRLNVDLLATYLISPGTAIYVGYNNDLADLDGPGSPLLSGLVRPRSALVSDGRQFFVKASYLFRR